MSFPEDLPTHWCVDPEKRQGLPFIPLVFLGALFLGLLACGPAAPQDAEGEFTGVTAFPQEYATQKPTEEPQEGSEEDSNNEESEGEPAGATVVPAETPTSTPTPTPRPTECATGLDSEGNPFTICDTPPEPPPQRPKLVSRAYYIVTRYEDELKEAKEQGEATGIARQVVVPNFMGIVYPTTQEDIPGLREFLNDNNVHFWLGGKEVDRYFTAALTATLVQELENRDDVIEIEGFRYPNPRPCDN